MEFGDKRVVGAREVKKAVLAGKAAKVLIAEDCDNTLAEEIANLCIKCGVCIDKTLCKKELGVFAKIEVACATVALLKE